MGLPYQGEAGAFWALLADDVELRRTTYDVESAIESLSATFPLGRDIFGESLRGRTPPIRDGFLRIKRHAS